MLRISVAEDVTLPCAIMMTRDTGSTSSRNTIRDIQMILQGRCGIGVWYKVGQAGDVKNDLHAIYDSQIQGYTDTGIVLEGYNAKLHHYERVWVQGRETGKIAIDTARQPGCGGSFTAINCEFQESLLVDFRLGRPNDPVTVIDCYSQSSRMFFETVNEEGGPQPTRFWPIRFIGCKWASPRDQLADDHVVLRVRTPGPVSLQSCKIGGNRGVVVIKGEYQPQRVAGFAGGVLTATTRPNDGDTVTIGTTVYTFRTTRGRRSG